MSASAAVALLYAVVRTQRPPQACGRREVKPAHRQIMAHAACPRRHASQQHLGAELKDERGIGPMTRRPEPSAKHVLVDCVRRQRASCCRLAQPTRRLHHLVTARLHVHHSHADGPPLGGGRRRLREARWAGGGQRGVGIRRVHAQLAQCGAQIGLSAREIALGIAERDVAYARVGAPVDETRDVRENELAVLRVNAAGKRRLAGAVRAG